MLINVSDEFEGTSLYKDYSGRGMYGEKCIGFEGPMKELTKLLMKLGVYLSEDDAYDLQEAMMERPSWDSMGLDSIVYFPGVQVSEQQMKEIEG